MEIREAQRICHETAVEKGWWDEGKVPSFGDLIALIHSELSEAYEEYRNGHNIGEVYYKDGKPEGAPTEFADVFVRIFSLCSWYGIDLEKVLLEKMEYNKSRPYRHGGKVR